VPGEPGWALRGPWRASELDSHQRPAPEIAEVSHRARRRGVVARSLVEHARGVTSDCSLASKELYLWRLVEQVLSTPLAGIPGFRQIGSQVGRWPR